MQISNNEISGNTMITVDDHEIQLLIKALWDEQLLYHGLLNTRKYNNEEQKRQWEEKLRELMLMTKQLGGNTVR